MILRALPPDALRELSRRSDARGALDVAVDWALIGASFALVAWFPGVLSVLAALVVLGGRQLALMVLSHEATHHSLFRTRALNDRVGNWLCAYPTWGDTPRYRQEHLRHHRHTGSPEDPDLGLSAPYPTTRGRFVRRVLRDLSGLTGLRRVAGLLLIDLGYYTYTASTNSRPIPGAHDRGLGTIAITAVRNLHGMLITNGLLFAVLAVSGHPELYLLWVGAWMTTYSLFVRLRAVSEHGATPSRDGALTNTRTTLVGWWTRLTLAPHHVNYHLAHHLAMSVPHWRLAELHRLLTTRGLLEGACVERGYPATLRKATEPTVS